MNPFETVVQNPWLPFWLLFVLVTFVGLSLIFTAALFGSYRKMFGWYESIAAAWESGRWDMLLLPPKDLTAELFFFGLVGGIWAIVIGAGIFIIGLFVYVTV